MERPKLLTVCIVVRKIPRNIPCLNVKGGKHGQKEVETVLGEITTNNLIGEMLEGEEAWEIIREYIEKVIAQKELD